MENSLTTPRRRKRTRLGCRPSCFGMMCIPITGIRNVPPCWWTRSFLRARYIVPGRRKPISVFLSNRKTKRTNRSTRGKSFTHSSTEPSEPMYPNRRSPTSMDYGDRQGTRGSRFKKASGRRWWRFYVPLVFCIWPNLKKPLQRLRFRQMTGQSEWPIFCGTAHPTIR